MSRKGKVISAAPQPSPPRCDRLSKVAAKSLMRFDELHGGDNFRVHQGQKGKTASNAPF